jgi:hypothetical protein
MLDRASRCRVSEAQVNRVLRGVTLLGLCLFAACLFAADCHRRVALGIRPIISQLDQSNTPPWDGGWSIIGRGSPAERFAQTFTPLKSRLTAVEIDVMTGNRGRGGDDITVTVVQGDRVLATVSRPVAEGFDGMLRFDFPAPGIMVRPGTALQLRVEDTNKNVFGWRYGLNTYPGGVAYFDGAPWNNGAVDFRFRTYGY